MVSMLTAAGLALTIVVATGTALIMRWALRPAPESTPSTSTPVAMAPDGFDAERYWREGDIARARLTGEVPIAARVFYEIFTDFEHWGEFMPGVSSATLQEPDLDTPIGSNQARVRLRRYDSVLSREITADLEFSMEPSSEVVMRTVSHPYGSIREIWRMRRVAGRAGAQVEYERFAKVETDLPPFLENAQIRQHFLDVLGAVTTRAGVHGTPHAAAP